MNKMNKMEEEMGIVNSLRVIPWLLGNEQFRSLLKLVSGAITGPSVSRVFSTLLNTVRITGLTESMRSLISLDLTEMAPSFIISWWEANGNMDALITEKERITYRELSERTLRLANGLLDLGVKHMDRICVMLPNGKEHAEGMIAPWFAGCRSSQINWHLSTKELNTLMNVAKPKAIIIQDDFIDNKIMRDKVDIENYIVVGEDVPEGAISYEDLLASSSTDIPKGKFVFGINPYTGGTTGMPKSIGNFEGINYLLTHKGERPRGAESYGEFLKYMIWELLGFIPRPDDLNFSGLEGPVLRPFVTGPMYHGVPIMATVLMLIAAVPTTIMAARRFDPEIVLKLIDREKTSMLVGVPTHFQRILTLPDEIVDKYDVSSVRLIFSDGAPCPPETKKRVNEFFMKRGVEKPVFMEGYGAVEFTGAPTILFPHDYIENPKRYESVGKVGTNGEVIVVDEEGNKCPQNEVGKILIRTVGTIGLDYLDAEPDKVEKALTVVDGKEWYDDGTLGYIDEDGYLYLTGRTKEMIICGGVNLAPNEIENVIIRNPKVAETTVIRAPDKDLGEVPLAIVQLKEGKEMTEDELKDWCKKEGLYGFMIPKIVEFREVPVAAYGKVRKMEIEEEYWEKKGIKRRG